MTDFMTLPPHGPGGLVLRNLGLAPGVAGAEAAVLAGAGPAIAPRADGMRRIDIALRDGRIVALPPDPGAAGMAVAEMQGAMVLPAFVDMHTHLDKGHIWPRSPNPDGTFGAALAAAGADRTARWDARDLRARMEFSLRCAFAHGTRAIRTHLDSLPPQDAISFPVFDALRADWAGRIELQAACLVTPPDVSADGPFRATADRVAATPGGVLGMVSFPVPDLEDRLRLFLRMAADRGLAADLHVDETLDPTSDTLDLIARLVTETGFDAPVTVGHCCALSAMEEGRALAILDRVARAGLQVVSLPMCNLYLQDRQPGRTPRMRGLTLVHEMAARGIPVSFASDNTRDPFYAYGDMDMLEVLREATRIGHLDHGREDWVQAVLGTPARACGFAAPSLAPGAPADLVILPARSWNEALARPQANRIVLRNGRPIDRTLPAFAELDPLMDRP